MGFAKKAPGEKSTPSIQESEHIEAVAFRTQCPVEEQHYHY